jgi:hypothetical protein
MFDWTFVDVPARIHPFVQYAHDLDQAILDDAIEENVNRSCDLDCVSRTTCMSHVEAADAGTKIRSLPRERSVRLVRRLPHRVGQNSRVFPPAVRTPTIGTC